MLSVLKFSFISFIIIKETSNRINLMKRFDDVNKFIMYCRRICIYKKNLPFLTGNLPKRFPATHPAKNKNKNNLNMCKIRMRSC